MTILINEGLVYLGFICSLFVLVRYQTQRWYRNPLGPILIIVFLIMTFLYGKSAWSIVTGHHPLTAPVYTVVNAICAALSLYAAFSLDYLIRARRRKRKLDREREAVEEKITSLSSNPSSPSAEE